MHLKLTLQARFIKAGWKIKIFVKLQSKVQTSVLGLGVDFVLPLSQEQEEEEQQQKEEEPHQNIAEGNILRS